MESTFTSYIQHVRNSTLDFAHTTFAPVTETTTMQTALCQAKRFGKIASDCTQAAIDITKIIGSTIEKWTNNNLPPKYAEISQRIFNSSPVILANTLLPSPLITGTWCIYGITQFINKEAISEKMSQHLFDGTGFVFAGKALVDLGQFALTRQVKHLLSAGMQSIIATLFLSTHFSSKASIPSILEPAQIPLPDSPVMPRRGTSAPIQESSALLPETTSHRSLEEIPPSESSTLVESEEEENYSPILLNLTTTEDLSEVNNT